MSVCPGGGAGRKGACMGGTCMMGGVWYGEGGMHSRGHTLRGGYVWWGCMVGDVHGGGIHGRGHAWQGACVAGACMAWGMHGRGHAWQGVGGMHLDCDETIFNGQSFDRS